MVIVVTEKHPKLLFYSSKIPFLVVEFSILFLLEEMLVLMSYERQLQ